MYAPSSPAEWTNVGRARALDAPTLGTQVWPDAFDLRSAASPTVMQIHEGRSRRMKRLLPHRPSYAIAVAIFALVVALSGTAVAKPVEDAAVNAGARVKKALKLSREANKKASKAVKACLASDRRRGEAEREGRFP
jgi:hypothetical protein